MAMKWFFWGGVGSRKLGRMKEAAMAAVVFLRMVRLFIGMGFEAKKGVGYARGCRCEKIFHGVWFVLRMNGLALLAFWSTDGHE